MVSSARAWVKQAGWRRVENGLAVIAIDNRKRALAATFDEEETPLAGLKALFEKAAFAVFGLDATSEETRLDSFATFSDGKTTDAVKAVQALLVLG